MLIFAPFKASFHWFINFDKAWSFLCFLSDRDTGFPVKIEINYNTLKFHFQSKNKLIVVIIQVPLDAGPLGCMLVSTRRGGLQSHMDIDGMQWVGALEYKKERHERPEDGSWSSGWDVGFPTNLKIPTFLSTYIKVLSESFV